MITYISRPLIQRTITNKEDLRAIAVSFAIKAKFRSSQINDFTYSRLASMFNIGRETAKRRIERLKSLGLVRFDGNNLLFLSLSDSWMKNNIKVLDYTKIDTNNLKEVEKFLRLQAVYIKQSQINYAVNVKRATASVSDMKELRANKRKLRKLSYWGGETDRGQSIKTVSNVSGLGINGAVELLQWGEKMGLLDKDVRIFRKKFVPTSEQRWKISKKSRVTFFVSNGNVFSAIPTVITFTGSVALY